jgi:hypothetical protein
MLYPLSYGAMLYSALSSCDFARVLHSANDNELTIELPKSQQNGALPTCSSCQCQRTQAGFRARIDHNGADGTRAAGDVRFARATALEWPDCK